LGVATVLATNFAMLGSGSAVLAVAAGSIAKHHEDREKVRSGELVDFFKEAIQDPGVRDSIKDAVREGGIGVATHVNTAMNQLGAAAPESGQFVDSMKSEITVVIQQIGIIRDMLSYYEIPDSNDRVKNVWRLPSYIDDVLVIDEVRKDVIDTAVKHIRDGENVVILGAPGSGKTTAMYAIWKELDDDTDTALVWDTKDVSRVHEKDGVILFSDDLPETRELSNVIVERDIRGIVTTAREQEWSRLPISLREKFVSVALPKAPDDVMKEIAKKHLESQNIKYTRDALGSLVKSAQGSPIYVRYMAEEIGTEVKAGILLKLTKERVRKAPRGMTDYVAGILARMLFDLEGTIYKPKDGALPVIKTLLCLADMPNYETHEVHMNQIFFMVKAPTDGPGPFNAIKQYLSRDPRFFSLKFMHDTLADVLRGRVDHPIVGDIRMLAQEMGVAGRRKVQKDALNAGWEDVKAEYEIDKAGGLEPLLAYSYFAAKNFGNEYVDRLSIDLANQHLENPLSQGLFAITGPITEGSVLKIEDEIQTTSKDIVPPAPPEPPLKPEAPDDLANIIMDKVAPALGKDVAKDISDGLKDLGQLSELSKFSGDGISTMVSKAVGDALKGAKVDVTTPRRSSLDSLETLLKQESVSPRKLSRALRKAAIKVESLADRGKLKDKAKVENVLSEGASRLVLLDSMMYIDLMDQVSDGMSACCGEKKTAKLLTDTTECIAVDMLDNKTRKQITDVFVYSAKRAERLGDYDGMRAHLSGKWKLTGVDPKDLTYVSNQIGKLMEYGRTPYAFETLTKFNDLFSDGEGEKRLGLTLQAFKRLSKAVIEDRTEFGKIVELSQHHFLAQIEWMEKEALLVSNPTAAELCTSLTTSLISMMENYVKKSGKAVAAEGVYPLLHESIEELVVLAATTLQKVGDSKASKTLANSIQKMKGESKHKSKMIETIKAL
jgi:hypothetical protein